MFSHPLYKNSPVWLQEWLIYMRSAIRKALREDADFRQFLADVELQQYWSFEQLEDLRKKELDLLLRRAETAVPFYRQVQTRSIEADPFKKLEQFPVIIKKNVIVNPDAFIASDMPKWPRFPNSTSGTTGVPLTLFQTLNAIKRENAFVKRQMYWAGYKEGDKFAWLRGDMIVPATVSAPPFWRLNRSENSLMMSSYHLMEKNAPAYLDALQQFDPVLIQAYPSSIYYLANWLLKRGQKANLLSLKGIMTSSETLSDVQRKQIEAAFGVRVFDWYGSVERVAAIGTCEYGRYHIIEDYSLVEFGPEQDGAAEIIGTGFHNPLMPLIRYATGDSVELEAPDAQCECKRPFRLVKRVLGRIADVVKTPDGRSIGMIDPIWHGFYGISEAQIVQETLDTLEIRVVLTQDAVLPKEIKNELIANLQAKVGLGMYIRVVEVASIPRTKNGKFITVLSKLN
jgi:phenylacetate-CoA ligase